MTAGPPPTAGPGQPQLGLQCVRCGRTQPPLPGGVFTCVYCSAALPVLRWRAHPPPAATVPTTTRPHVPARRPGRYAGPPSYRGAPPRWGFPPVAWRPADLAAVTSSDRQPVRKGALRLAGLLCALTAMTAALAAAAETWRYVLLLRGRTVVLPDAPVNASTALVVATGWTALGLSIIASLAVVPLLARLHGDAAVRAGRLPSRPAAAVVARLVVPGWNLWGTGEVLAEIDAQLDPRATEPGPAIRVSRLVLSWWLAWLVNAFLTVLTLVRAFGRSDQAIGDTVELHIALDLAAALVAGLLALLLHRFQRRLAGEHDPWLGWTVAPPAPTSDRRPAVRTHADPPGSADAADLPERDAALPA